MRPLAEHYAAIELYDDADGYLGVFEGDGVAVTAGQPSLVKDESLFQGPSALGAVARHRIDYRRVRCRVG